MVCSFLFQIWCIATNPESCCSSHHAVLSWEVQEEIYSLFCDFCYQVYKQKVKHLLYEHQNNMSEIKAESTVALKLAQDDHRGNEVDLRRDKRDLKVSLKEQQLQHEQTFKNLQLVQKFFFFSPWQIMTILIQFKFDTLLMVA